jgi:hypothetical protein
MNQRACRRKRDSDTANDVGYRIIFAAVTPSDDINIYIYTWIHVCLIHVCLMFGAVL